MHWPFATRANPPADGPRYADIYSRALAAALDLALLFVLFSWPFRILTGLLYRRVDTAILNAATPGLLSTLEAVWRSGLGPMWLLNSVLQLLAMMAALTLAYAQWRATPGKWLLGLRIVDAQTLAPISTGRFAARLLALIPSAMPAMIGIFWASFHARRRGWHDLMAGTVVLDSRPPRWYWEQAKRLYVIAREALRRNA